MFRQDRTNPSTAVSNWRGRHDTPKAWPSTGVSTWLNGALFGGGVLTAFGGIITQYEDSGTTYRVHTFRGSGKFFVSSGAGDVDYLIVGGGGSGGEPGFTNPAAGGGGGGGAVKTGTTAVSAGTYTVTVGQGGPHAHWNVSDGLGTNGENSVALGVTANGGGGGGGSSSSGANRDGLAGGSGGGGGKYSEQTAGVGGAANDGGNAGGDSAEDGGGYDYPFGGGGGGEGGAGGDPNLVPTPQLSGPGGSGESQMGITASAVIYAGGGSGAAVGGTIAASSANATGIPGGGGQGLEYTAWVITPYSSGGVPNSGGGGGAGAIQMSEGTYDNSVGGAGIVLIRYEVAA